MISATSSSAARTAIKTIQSSTCVIDTNQTKPLQACHPVRIVLLPEVSSCQKCPPVRIIILSEVSSCQKCLPERSEGSRAKNEQTYREYREASTVFLSSATVQAYTRVLTF